MAGRDGGDLPLVPLDACCLLNLCATRRLEDILQALPFRAAATDRAAAEVRYLRRGGSGADADERDLVDLQPLLAAGLLTILHLETEQEAARFVQLAAELDDGEAMTFALAIERGLTVATDDRKALRLLARVAPHLQAHTTAGLLQRWAALRQVSPSEQRQTLLDVQERARFAPNRDDPLQEWWETAVRTT